MCDVIKKIFKVVGILVAIAGAVAGVFPPAAGAAGRKAPLETARDPLRT